MKRFNLLFTVVIGVIFILLMFFADQPITPEADLVQRWYDTFCSPKANQSLIYTYTWRGNLTDTQLQVIMDMYRSANNYLSGCAAVVNPNIIYFEAIPTELASTVDRIKFVAVNLYAPDQPHDSNHILSIRTSVHVLFYKNGRVKILPHFIPDSPSGLHQGSTPVNLYNNDGLLMGQVQLNGDLIQVPEGTYFYIGIPLRISTVREWGNAWVRLYADNIEVTPITYIPSLPEGYRNNVITEFPEAFAANQVTDGFVWFAAAQMPADLRLSIDANQTRWDMPGLPIMLKVR